MKKLPKAPGQYDERDQIALRQTIEEGDRENLKKDQDIDLGAARLILTSPDGARWAIRVDSLGQLTSQPA